jgi:hypothetical protein
MGRAKGRASTSSIVSERFVNVLGRGRGGNRPTGDNEVGRGRGRGRTYPNLEAFYAENESRRHSPEADYGVDWRGPDGARGWRVSYCGVSGEIYGLRDHGASPALVVLGSVPADRDPLDHTNPTSYYATLDRLLGEGTPDSWAQRMNTTDGWAWLCARLSSRS